MHSHHTNITLVNFSPESGKGRVGTISRESETCRGNTKYEREEKMDVAVKAGTWETKAGRVRGLGVQGNPYIMSWRPAWAT